jgi:glycosyltransferase involved in cell wall biosynthesis
MRIEAITVCVDYSDFLAETLPHVMSQVDELLVVTTPEDRRTRQLCHRYGVRCLPTKCFYREGAKFNKARGINYGLANLALNDWVLHIDADVVLPPRFRQILERGDLDTGKLYGCDRVNCIGRDAWEAFKRSPDLQYEWSCMVHPPRRWAMGSRIAHFDYGGYCPIGFFQLWHARGSGIERYPIHCQGTAEHTDVLHAIQWDRRDRVLIPELIAIHLETRSKTTAAMGANWSGRTTPEFTMAEGQFPSSDHRKSVLDRPESSPDVYHSY